MDDQKKGGSVQNYVIVAIIAFALGLGSGAMWAGKKSVSDVTVSTDTGATSAANASSTDTASGVSATPASGAPTGTMVARNAIIVHDQKPGTTVVVSAINIDKSSWAVIREDDGTGHPGKILGAQLFDPGTNAGTVDLLRGTQDGNTYYAMIYTDNGDRAFDPKTDLPLIGPDGQPVTATFKASASAPDVTPNTQ